MEDSKLQFSCEIIAIVANCKQAYTLSLVPRPHQLFIAISTEKWERAWYLFSREWRQDRKDSRKGLIVRGCTGPRTAKRVNVSGINLPPYLASGGWLSYTLSVECVVSWTICKMQPVCSENFRHFRLCHAHEKRYQALSAFPYCKRQKAGRGLETRLVHKNRQLN